MIGNKTRRKILATLSQQPMYFNQLSKEIGVSQQAVLRHLQSLEAGGFVKTYSKKSNLGAPDRKYYRLNSSFTLTISISHHSFSIKNHNINGSEERKESDNRLHKKFNSSKKYQQRQMVNQIYTNLAGIDNELADLETRLINLKAFKRLLVNRLHKMGIDSFSEY
jgi:ArsR family transcriptional regulator